jgi:CRP/FNR family transcriptional regulator, cyclic AMP receptor protein
MDQGEGLRILTAREWLSATPPEFQRAILAPSSWHRFEPGDPIQTAGRAENGAMAGLASGIVELRSVLGRADTPIMHYARPVFWFGYRPVVTGRRLHKVEATAKTVVHLARVPHADIKKILNERPEWWQYFLQPAFFFADIALNIAADFMIRDSERRCAAVLLRLGGRRFAGPDDEEPVDVFITQEELAGAANLSRNSAGAILKRLSERGLVELGHRAKIVCFPTALRAFVEQV